MSDHTLPEKNSYRSSSKKDYHLDRLYIKSPLNFEGITLFQIGRLFCKQDTVVDAHVHGELFELTIATDGRGEIITNGISIPVEKGDIYVSFPCDSHKIISDSVKPLKYDFFAFNSDLADFKEDLNRIMQNYHAATTRIIHDERIRTTVSNALSELNQEHLYSDKLLASLFRLIIIYVIRGFRNVTPETHSDSVTHAEKLCYQMMNYIDTHIYSMKNLDDLAAVMGYNYGYLSTLYKKTTANTLSNYFHERKLDVARMLVLENRLKIAEIAELLNYTSIYAFSKAFTNRYGVSPKNYRVLSLHQNSTP